MKDIMIRGKGSLPGFTRPCGGMIAGVLGLFVSACGALAGEPKLACDQPVYQFGNVEGSNAIEHTFTLWNRGDATLVMGKMRACCGATVAVTYTNVAPGSNTTLKVVLNLAGRNGDLKKSIYVASNDPKQPYLQVQMVGSVRPPVLVDPGFLNFGTATSNEVVTREVVITSLATMSLRVTNVVSATALFQAELVAVSNNFCRLRVRTAPPLPQGVTHGKITAFTDDAKHPSLEIQAVVTVSSDIVVVPEAITLTLATGQAKPVSRYFAIRSRSNTAFKIIKVEPPDPGIESVVTAMASGGWRCELRNVLPFAELDGKQVIVTTDHPTSSSIAILFRVTGEKAK